MKSKYRALIDLKADEVREHYIKEVLVRDPYGYKVGRQIERLRRLYLIAIDAAKDETEEEVIYQQAVAQLSQLLKRQDGK